MKPKEIAVYGGSFNPPHRGHHEAARTALEMLHPDRFLIVPDNTPPHKELEEGSPSPDERLQLCRLCFSDLPGVEISEMEIRRSGKSYTYDTVRELQAQFPKAHLTLIVGTDMFLSFEEWYHFEYLLSCCRLAVLARDLDDDELLWPVKDRFCEEYGADIVILPHTPFPVSSTEIRSALHRRGAREYVTDEVYAELIRRRFYDAQPELGWLREQAYAMLSEKRIAHVAGCESEAIALARRWGEDPELAAEAAILHDITKRLPPKDQLHLCKKYGMICDVAEKDNPALLHAKTGAALARDRFGVPDAVFEAIRWHTTGKPDMNLLEKILYLADYIEPTRDFPGVDRLRTLAYEDIDRAMVLGLEMSLAEIRSRGKEPYIVTQLACEWFIQHTLEKGTTTC